MTGKRIKPYSGSEPYIFVSYSHRDMSEAFEIIEALISKGYRVWYDEGIDPGTEWDEYIAMHIENCGSFLALISDNYVSSSNCKDEVKYARDKDRPRLLVYLKETELPGGMSMRLNRLQAIHKYTYTQKADFYEKLFSAPVINSCFGGTNSPAGAEPRSNTQAVPAAAEKENNDGGAELEFVRDLKLFNGSYTGQMKNGKRNGQGVFTFANGDVYDGGWKDGKYSGHGIFRYFDGNVFEGNYSEGRRNGHGVFTWENGDVYDGEWKDGKFHGHGVFKSANGDVYDGGYSDGKRSGHGVFTFASGNIYNGEWKDGKYNGNGIFSYTNGDTYEGEFRDGKYCGRGIFTSADGSSYEGEWEDNKYSGYGVFTYNDGSTKKGEWRNGKFVAPSAASSGSARTETGNCSVILVKTGAEKIKVIKTIRELTGLGLAEAKAAADFTPSTILKGVSAADAETAKATLEEYGANAEIKYYTEKSTGLYSVILVKTGSDKIKVIRAIRELTGLGLAEAKAAVAFTPTTVMKDVSAEKAKAAKAELEKAGAEAKIK